MKILFAGGGTLGPVTPLVAVIEEIRLLRPEVECVFVGTSQGPERRLVEEAGIRFVSLDAPKLRRYADPRTLFAPFFFLRALWNARQLLMREQPRIVVGAGGYVQVPLGLAAKFLGMKLLVHQQDAVVSLSNRLLAPFADAITTTFDASLGDFSKRKTFVIGNPVRRMIEEGNREAGLREMGFAGERPVILVLGGGTGSVFLNRKIADSLPMLTDFADVVHLTGFQKSMEVPKLEHAERYRQREFLGAGMADALAAADMVICRAGLGTLTELAALQKASILVPIGGSHQERNAELVVERGGAKWFRESECSPEALAQAARDLGTHPEVAGQLGRALGAIFRPGARAALAKKVLSLLS